MKAKPIFNLNIKLTALNIVTSIFLAAVAIGQSHLYLPETDTTVTVSARTVKLNAEVSKETMDKAILAIKRMMQWNSKQGILLHLNTPGGSVFDGRELELVLGRLKNVTTYVDNMAASMGFDIFIRAEKRVIHPSGLLMAHRGSVGPVTYHMLVSECEYLESKEQKTAQDLAKISQLRDMITVMDKLFEPCFKRLYELKKTAPNPAATQKLIDALAVGDHDIWLNAQEAVEAGLATSISNDIPSVDESVGKAGPSRV